MNISYRWLRDLIPDLTASPAEVASRLASLGAPVDGQVELSEEIGDVVIARVTELRPHPNADRLRLCTVDAGGEEPLQVVCGAPNVEADRFYPLAPVGARLPGGMEIRKAKLRGEVSEGMLCSARELNLGKSHAGLMTLQGEWEPGQSLVAALGLDDTRLVVDITPNRADLLSHLGVAREVAPGGVEGIRLPAFPGAESQEIAWSRSEEEGAAGPLRVRIDDSRACPRYLGAVLRGVRVGPSPEWLATRLRAVGVRPVNNVVDATNYVLFELGQPLHAFDLGRLRGGEIRVRRAESSESLRTLDGEERELAMGTLVIADAEGPVALAGVMGGEESEVTEETMGLFLECALFAPAIVRSSARGASLSTDASYRFERGVDPEGLPTALRRAVELIRAVAGGEMDGPALDLQPEPREEVVVELRPDKVRRLLGVEMGSEEIADYLRPLGFDVVNTGTTLRVTAPSHRHDIAREVDLVEEVARRRGYDSFPAELLAYRPGTVPEDPRVAVEVEVRALFRRWGFLEARTAGFAPASEERVPLLNPLSAEESHLRDQLVLGLLRRLEHNWARGVRDVRLFEIGSVFHPAGASRLPREEVRVAAVFTGGSRPPHWSGEVPSWDVWDLKGLLEELSERVLGGELGTGGALDLEPLTRERERLRIVDGSKELAVGGQVVEGAVDAPAWAESVWLLEARIPESLPDGRSVTYRPLPEFPASERDVALLVPSGVEAEAIAGVVRETAGELLEELWPFDLYVGKGVPEGTRSLAWRLRFRAADRTLTDPEVDAAMQRLLSGLEDRLGVRRR